MEGIQPTKHTRTIEHIDHSTPKHSKLNTLNNMSAIVMNRKIQKAIKAGARDMKKKIAAAKKAERAAQKEAKMRAAAAKKAEREQKKLAAAAKKFAEEAGSR